MEKETIPKRAVVRSRVRQGLLETVLYKTKAVSGMSEAPHLLKEDSIYGKITKTAMSALEVRNSVSQTFLLSVPETERPKDSYCMLSLGLLC